MPERDLKINGECYYDPTAYKAIEHAMRGKEKDIELYNGDIFEVRQTSGMTDTAVILSVHKRFSTALILKDDPALPIKVKGVRIQYVDPAMIGYIFNDKFTSFVRSLDDDEYKEIMQAVVDELGYVPDDRETGKEPAEEGEITDGVVDLQTMEELTRTKAERDVYKSLYENLLGSMLPHHCEVKK